MIILRIMILFLYYSVSYAQCDIFYHEKPLSIKKYDAVSALLKNEASCPQSIQRFKQLINNHHLQIKTSIVANRGKNNPDLGSFSFFESVTGVLQDGFQINSGEFFLGHFTTLDQCEIQLDQVPDKNKLLIELIAWDSKKRIFNFYELRGVNATETRWYYRGNSKDALLDNHYLYRDTSPDSAKFGNRMRCSACHDSGGPIMKEMRAPYNDWWTNANPLIFLPNHPSEEMNLLLTTTLVNAKQFSNEVQAGINHLNRSARYRNFKHRLTLQEQLRPLFCTIEINIESNTSGISSTITIPSGFWLNPLLGELKIEIPEKMYQNLLIKYDVQFPETDSNDADHAWLAPVKGTSDIAAIEQLIKTRLITQQFAHSVLMIDYAHPLFSRQRCELLKLVPLKLDHRWKRQFIKQLQAQSEQPAALLLATYLTNNQEYNDTYFQQVLSDYKNDVINKIKSENGLQDAFIRLLETRQEVRENELSQNPLGQILEPGFRVIFPVHRPY